MQEDVRPNDQTDARVNDQSNAQTSDRPNDLTKVTVAQAAKILGLSAEAVRMRIKRGTLKHVKENNSVYVLLPPSRLDTDRPNQHNDLNLDQTFNRPSDLTSDQPQPLVDALQAEVEFLREELRRRDERHAEEVRRKDHLLAAALDRVPQLEASDRSPTEPRDAPETVSEGPAAGEGLVDEAGGHMGEPRAERQVPWWRRMFGG